MGDANALAPIIIIKRKKVVAAAGHHGGAWKVAYADFVTAMMAFFMLLWLLNATTESQRKGIADYFSPTIPINRISGGGEGMFGGDSVFSEESLPQNGTGGSDKKPSAEHQAKGNSGVDTAEAAQQKAQVESALQDIKDAMDSAGGESSIGDELLQHIFTRVSDEGLIVEIFDLPGAPLFEGVDDQPSVILHQLTSMLARVFEPINSQIAINGYTRSYPIILRQNPSWDLSTDRAHEIRRMLVAKGLPQTRMHRVAGWSDRKPVEGNAMSVRNNRLEIILLRTDRAATGK
ncbi:MAG: chemotaxis protein MotB [Paracoccaceae bacterium]|jgi:chemotaxis protein MotB